MISKQVKECAVLLKQIEAMIEQFTAQSQDEEMKMTFTQASKDTGRLLKQVSEHMRELEQKN
ncbi:DUF1657 domain-containing protein [Metabacillus iocasae]|uniref:Uncharacterized protein n=1 Tax=Priestia iocasae TaxID=2291674 RepID=A0ABS2QTB8_9BACI|nr:DUF1657 domain-containing protein [Metabacillus iocasae]MBM7702533.1 hypothetical protein [Metabacillus iocasae]